MKPLISIGPFTLYFFGLMIAIGAVIGIFLFIRGAKKHGMNHNVLLDVAVYSVIGGIIGARLVYVLVYNPSFYLANPINILFVHQGGLSIHGGIIGGLLVGYLLLKYHKIPIWKTLDLVAPSLILAQGISRIGCDVFGGPISSSLPWGMEVNGDYLHPAQAYEFILDFILFGYLWLRLKRISYNGQVFLHYLIGFMIIRGIVEFSRINPIILGPFTVSHLMSLLGIIVGIILIKYRKKTELVKKHHFIKFKSSDFIKVVLLVLVLILSSLLLYFGVQG
ncbi:prolipoprotein diacylglyceryl transferase [Aquibacillus sediminis]|uniref:prolipoprotein diacylglyceryl transferase n=1 Tax=Aquibacillus sediminis TaxID=2574734 RepID=UPI001108158B|nr:prolipoprotein diacylglyceryl transferase [Aquibacillus sediminis]